MTTYDSPAYAILNRWDRSHLGRINRLIEFREGDRVLEVGCGRGHLTKALARFGIDVVGIDANIHAASFADSDLVHHMSAESLRFEDDSFDAIVSVHAIEHMTSLKQALVEMTRVLRPGGTAVHIYPAEPIRGLYALPAAVLLHGSPLRAREVHCNRLWPSKLRSIMEPIGMHHVHSEFNLLRSPQFASVFQRLG